MYLGQNQKERHPRFYALRDRAHLLFIAFKSLRLESRTGASTPNGFLDKADQRGPLTEAHTSEFLLLSPAPSGLSDGRSGSRLAVAQFIHPRLNNY